MYRLTVLLAVLFLGMVSAFAQDAGLPGPSTRGVVPSPMSAPPSVALSAQSSPAVISDEHYRLGIGDKVRITIYGEPDLSGQFTVDSAGQVQLPLVGQVNASNRTIHEFQEVVTLTLADGYLNSPKVSIEVLTYRPFYIYGEVNKPGEYPYENGLTVLSAVALAGGFTYRANDKNVFVRRNGKGSEEELRADDSLKIMPGDILRVAERLF